MIDVGNINLRQGILLQIILQQTHQGRLFATKPVSSFLCRMGINYEKTHHDEYLISDQYVQQNLSKSKMHEHHNVYELQAIDVKLVSKVHK